MRIKFWIDAENGQNAEKRGNFSTRRSYIIKSSRIKIAKKVKKNSVNYAPPIKELV